MIRIATIVGARPQFIKAAALSRTIRQHYSNNIEEILVHTGQHYDENMSDVFFRELELDIPAHNLNIGSDRQGKQTALMIEGIENILTDLKPDAVVVYGDTNSTLAAAIASAKIPIPLVHIEAGLRSFNKKMPEEINRIVCDHCSTLLFTPTPTGLANLQREGFNINTAPPYSSDNPGIFHCGDIMFDNAVYFSKKNAAESGILQILGLIPNEFILATIHRSSNTDDPVIFSEILSSLLSLADKYRRKVVFPVHPRSRKRIGQLEDKKLAERFLSHPAIQAIQPVSFLEMMTLEKNAYLIITDSGGVQKEAYFFGKPCIIVRSETEWIEMVEHGCAILTGNEPRTLIDAYAHFRQSPPLSFPPVFGDGKTSHYICTKLIECFTKQ